MIELKDLLGRFDNVLRSGSIARVAVHQAVLEATGIAIPEENIEIKGSSVYLKIKPLYKAEIYLKQEKILSCIEKTLGAKAPRELR